MAENKLTEFIAEIKNGVAIANHFVVDLHFPAAFSQFRDINNNLRKAILFCDQAQLPGLSFSTSPVRTFGEMREVPYEKLFEPIQLSFYVDNDFMVKALFDQWMNLIQDAGTRTFNYPKTYISDFIKIIMLNREDNRLYEVKLFNVFPKAVAPIQLDYSSRDIIRLNVTLSYQYAETTQVAQATIDGIPPTPYESLMSNYAYGYDTTSDIPINYFNDFSVFQNQFVDFTTGVKSVTSTENIGEITGFGGVFL